MRRVSSRSMPEFDQQSASASLQRWRRSVMRLWIATMIAAILVWALVAAARLPAYVETAIAAVLVALAVLSAWNMRRGRCPRCGARIRFAPRIELPPACPQCAAPFISESTL
jgi:ABC-type transport system involved in cytochrome bd biosynthesis fused ATPase/permease subunit